MAQSIIFDLDGTLWDSTNQLVKSWNNILKNHPDVNNFITLEKMKSFMGKTNDEIVKDFFAYLSNARGHQILELCQNEEVNFLSQNGGNLFPNVLETLSTLSLHFSLFIVSNCQKGYAEAFLEYYHLSDFFLDFECSGNTNFPKWKNIKLLMERNCIKDAIYVGDTQGDYNSALLANIPFIYANYGFGNVENAPYEISKLSDLLDIIPKLFNCTKNNSGLI